MVLGLLGLFTKTGFWSPARGEWSEGLQQRTEVIQLEHSTRLPSLNVAFRRHCRATRMEAETTFVESRGREP